jgi:hypothetical protein
MRLCLQDSSANAARHMLLQVVPMGRPATAQQLMSAAYIRRDRGSSYGLVRQTSRLRQLVQLLERHLQ